MKKVLMKGNHAIVEGAIQAGCTAYFGYPITPQNEITGHMAKRMGEEGRVFIQSESEIAAISMVFGASVAGARALTSSSSPGISLKQEGISYMAGCELPGVIVNIQRGGPGLGNISASQSDYFQATRGGGHGDYRTIVLAPYSVQEMYDLTRKSFELADKYRMPVIILADGYLGQIFEPVLIKDKLESIKFEKNWILDGCKNRKPRLIRSLFMGENELENHNWKLKKVYDTIVKKEVIYKALLIDDASVVLVAFGIPARICETAIAKLRSRGIKAGLVRPITLWPFPSGIISRLAQKVEAFIVIEMNLGQMVEDVKLAVNGMTRVLFYGRPGGGLPEVSQIVKISRKAALHRGKDGK